MKRLFYIVPCLLGIILSSCYKDEFERLNNRLDAIENTQIASINQQITSIKSSLSLLSNTDIELKGYITALETQAEELAVELADTNSKIDKIKEELTKTISNEKANILAELEAFKAAVNGELEAIKAIIEELKTKDTALEEQIADLRSYVDTELKSSEDWVTASFATLEQYNTVVTAIATIKGQIEAINASMIDLENRINEKIAKDIEAASAILSADLQNAIKEITEAYTSTQGVR